MSTRSRRARTRTSRRSAADPADPDPAPDRRVLRSTAVVIGAVATLAGLYGCASDDYDRYCVDSTSNTRVEDTRCDRTGTGGTGHYHWYYVRSGTARPAIGGSAKGGSFSVPARGGFGGHGEGGGS